MKRSTAQPGGSTGVSPVDRSTGVSPVRSWPGRPCYNGTVLIVTMWILIVLAGMVLVLARAMSVEGACSANIAAFQQASAVESGAIQYVLAHLDGLKGVVPSQDDMPCRAVQVGDGAFWIIKPDPEDDGEYSFSLVDEASRINLNSATVEMLVKLPGMTDELAAAIVDWRDDNDDTTPLGAEKEHYLLLADPYRCKNAPLETVEELMLVNGCSLEILFGEDANRNGVLDENENDADETDPPDNRDGNLDRGLYDLATVYSAEPNTNASGEQRVNVNQASTSDLSEALGEFVSKTRLPGVLNLARRRRPFKNVFDFHVRTGLKAEEFAGIYDRITTSNEKILTGLINVKTAPKEVLLSLPGLEEDDVSALIAGRSGEQTDASSIAWVLEALKSKKLIAVGSHITVRSFQFSADIVSISGNGRAFRRCRIVVDARNSPPRVIYRRDLTHLGWPIAPEIVEQLRAGTPIDQVIDDLCREVP